ncbi:hypothetical protein HMPREF1125_0750 [Streptococcus oralis SK304]|uniref:Uncharacterized protein n=1 Tax=Streptococcus oralis SK304 TaxID=1161421 RepID=J4K894_STROR|nr:hypothetical protein HMPREF1125_0750 [Streptococcus oralis SK304]EUC79323.1 hypothetical protein HMPREF1518_0987 [Streptococcus sp. SR1]
MITIFNILKTDVLVLDLKHKRNGFPIIFIKSLTSDLLSILTFTCLYKGVENEE